MSARKAIEPEFLTRKNGAKFAGLGTTTIDKAIRENQLLAFKVGRSVMIRRSDLEAWITARPIQYVSHNEVLAVVEPHKRFVAGRGR